MLCREHIPETSKTGPNGTNPHHQICWIAPPFMSRFICIKARNSWRFRGKYSETWIPNSVVGQVVPACQLSLKSRNNKLNFSLVHKQIKPLCPNSIVHNLTNLVSSLLYFIEWCCWQKTVFIFEEILSNKILTSSVVWFMRRLISSKDCGISSPIVALFFRVDQQIKHVRHVRQYPRPKFIVLVNCSI